MKKILREFTKPENSSFIVKEEIAAQFAAPFHFHEGYEFTYIVKGHGKFYGGDSLMNFTEGDLYLFGIGFPHYFINDKSFIKSGELAHSIIIQFGDDFLGGNFYLKPEFSAVKTFLKKAHLGIKVINPSAQLQRLMLDAPKRPGLKGLINLLELLDTVASLKSEEAATISTDIFENSLITRKKENKLDEVYRYVLENFKEQITSQKAASLAFMNESAFCRYFKRRTNKTLSQFVNHVRVTHAIQLLAEEDMSISKVCFECGFANLSYFNRQFKAVTGKTPYTYRKEFS
ncbi:AraC-type DNA-binding protein [Mucilaginibacter pineti]|uniref:AraC-type DNA-binding protein n=1 Tax=Mucilaginibacter pineti TaxID=1391627 RepID=A0A1G7M4R1_9SPHI|nr:AraC family transcriptional regulator [Mucilaginibacter pineti]SDF56772.1 AraC-type DNA-binding protein [Mucilaginibacter pineti]